MRVQRLVATKTVLLGGEVQIQLELEPSKPVNMKTYRSKARFVSREQFRTDEELKQNEFFVVELPLEIPVDFRERVVRSWSVKLPREVPPSFGDEDDFFTISSRVEVDLAWDTFGSARLEAVVNVLAEYQP